MKSKTTVEKGFDTVKVFREIKDRISEEIKGMTFEQLNEYLDKNKMNMRKS
jgi:hypothetical protein